MVRIVEAIYSKGMLEPLEALELAERQRVRLTIEPLQPEIGDVPKSTHLSSNGERSAARRALVDRLRKSPLSYDGPLPTRDELHER